MLLREFSFWWHKDGGDETRSQIITCAGSTGQNLEGRKTFSSTYVGKRAYGAGRGGGSRMSSWQCHSERVRIRKYEAQEKDIVHKLPPILKDLPFSEDSFPPSPVHSAPGSSKQPLLPPIGLPKPTSSHHFQHFRPCFLLLASRLQFDGNRMWTRGCIPLGKVTSESLSRLAPFSTRGRNSCSPQRVQNPGWSLHSGMEPLGTVSTQITTQNTKAYVKP